MSRIRTIVAGLTAIAATTTLGGAATQASVAQDSSEWQTMRFVSKTLEERPAGRVRWVGVDEVRKNGRLIGYNSIAGRIWPRRNHIVVRLGIALSGGVILGKVTADVEPGQDIVFRGPVQGGSGRFTGISGHIRAVLPAEETEGRATVVLRWHT